MVLLGLGPANKGASGCPILVTEGAFVEWRVVIYTPSLELIGSV